MQFSLSSKSFDNLLLLLLVGNVPKITISAFWQLKRLHENPAWVFLLDNVSKEFIFNSLP